MKIEPNKCFKCGEIIIHDRKPTSLWTQRVYKLENGNNLILALCSNCSLTLEDYKEASEALALDAPIVSDTGLKDTYIDVLKDTQGGKCFYCGKPLGDTYAISGGHISCERC